MRVSIATIMIGHDRASDDRVALASSIDREMRARSDENISSLQ
jgi:hypothetical protein